MSKDGISTNRKLEDKVLDWPTPRNLRDVRSFLGLTSYYHRFIPQYGDVADPLIRLTEAKKEFDWTPECQAAMETLKKHLTTAPILAYPDKEGTFILDTDASDVAMGAVLS